MNQNTQRFIHKRENLSLKGTQKEDHSPMRGQGLTEGYIHKYSLTEWEVRVHLIPGGFPGWCPNPRIESLAAGTLLRGGLTQFSSVAWLHL